MSSFISEDEWMANLDMARRNGKDYSRRMANVANDSSYSKYSEKAMAQIPITPKCQSAYDSLPSPNNQTIAKLHVGVVSLLFNLMGNVFEYCYAQVSFVCGIFSTILANSLSGMANAFDEWVDKEAKKREQDLEEFRNQTKEPD